MDREVARRIYLMRTENSKSGIDAIWESLKRSGYHDLSRYSVLYVVNHLEDCCDKCVDAKLQADARRASEEILRRLGRQRGFEADELEAYVTRNLGDT